MNKAFVAGEKHAATAKLNDLLKQNRNDE